MPIGKVLEIQNCLADSLKFTTIQTIPRFWRYDQSEMIFQLGNLSEVVKSLLDSVTKGVEHLEAYGTEVDSDFHLIFQKQLLVLTFIFIGGQRPQVVYEMRISVIWKKNQL